MLSCWVYLTKTNLNQIRLLVNKFWCFSDRWIICTKAVLKVFNSLTKCNIYWKIHLQHKIQKHLPISEEKKVHFCSGSPPGAVTTHQGPVWPVLSGWPVFCPPPPSSSYFTLFTLTYLSSVGDKRTDGIRIPIICFVYLFACLFFSLHIAHSALFSSSNFSTLARFSSQH